MKKERVGPAHPENVFPFIFCKYSPLLSLCSWYSGRGWEMEKKKHVYSCC